MIQALRLTLALAPLLTFAHAAEKSFSFGKGSATQQLVTFESVADFETFVGRTNQISGTVKFDPTTRKGSGWLEFDVDKLETGIEMRDKAMKSHWLHADKHPKVRFETTQVEHRKGDEYRVRGKLTLEGITRDVDAVAIVRYLPQSEETDKARFKGDVLHIRTTLKIKLSDFGIKGAGSKVNDEITLGFTAFGQTGL